MCKCSCVKPTNWVLSWVVGAGTGAVCCIKGAISCFIPGVIRTVEILPAHENRPPSYNMSTETSLGQNFSVHK